jgi:hypothetical protein
MGTILKPGRPGIRSSGSSAIRPCSSLLDLKFKLRRKKSLGVEEALIASVITVGSELTAIGDITTITAG